MPGPLEGTLNALNADPQASSGLRIPGYRFDNTPQAPQREMGLNDLVGRLASMAGQATGIPRQLAWNAGPALVGRPGEGPQNGAELFSRLGLDPNSPLQRAAGHGLGAGLDFMADPLQLVGMGLTRARAAAPVAEGGGNLIRRLEQHAGQGLGSNLAANPATGSIAGMEQGSLLNPRYSPSTAIGRQPFTAAEIAADRAAMTPRPATPPPVTPGWDFEALRRQQLNSPSFNPALPVEGLGTPAFTQGNPVTEQMLRSYPRSSAARPSTSLGEEMRSAGFSNVDDYARHLDSLGRPPSTPPASSEALARRLEQFAGGPQATPRPLSSQPPEYFNEARAGAVTMPESRRATLHDVISNFERPPQLGPPTPAPDRFRMQGPATPEMSPAPRPEFSPDQFRAFYEAVNNPGRGRTLGPRSPTVGPIDY